MNREQFLASSEQFAMRFAILFLRHELVVKGVLEPLTNEDVDRYVAAVRSEMDALADGVSRGQEEAKSLGALTERDFRHIVELWRMPLASAR